MNPQATHFDDDEAPHTLQEQLRRIKLVEQAIDKMRAAKGLPVQRWPDADDDEFLQQVEHDE